MPDRLLPACRLARTGAFALAAALALPAARVRAEIPAGTIPVVPIPIAITRPATPPAMIVSPGGVSPGQRCRQAIRTAERASGIPDQLMAAIGRVESGRREADGSVNPWPWSINADGEPHVFDTKAEAVAAVRALQAHGMRSIDVGCMQVNLMHHPDAFASLDQAFDPVANANYAARFLVQLHAQTGAWPTATAWYHSATPELGADYQRKVMAVWPEEKRHQGDTLRTDLVDAWAATRGVTATFASATAGSATPVGAAFVLPRPAGHSRILPQPVGTVGRSLSVYRALPIRMPLLPLATRPAAASPLVRNVNSKG